MFDNSTDEDAGAEIARVCDEWSVEYVRTGVAEHHLALNLAAERIRHAEYFGFLDHDVFPVEPTRLVPLIKDTGFYGIGQRHPPTGYLYLWPGFVFFSREWVGDRPLDFTGIRAARLADFGDTGSGLWPLFEAEDWSKLYCADHRHDMIRAPDEYGLQSYGFERMGSWLHFTNGAHWMAVPDPEERDRLLFEVLEAL